MDFKKKFNRQLIEYGYEQLEPIIKYRHDITKHFSNVPEVLRLLYLFKHAYLNIGTSKQTYDISLSDVARCRKTRDEFDDMKNFLNRVNKDFGDMLMNDDDEYFWDVDAHHTDVNFQSVIDLGKKWRKGRNYINISLNDLIIRGKIPEIYVNLI